MIKVARVDGKDQGLGLECLDEPCDKQSDCTVLDLQLRSISKTSTSTAAPIKKIGGGCEQDQVKAIESWIESITAQHCTATSLRSTSRTQALCPKLRRGCRNAA